MVPLVKQTGDRTRVKVILKGLEDVEDEREGKLAVVVGSGHAGGESHELEHPRVKQTSHRKRARGVVIWLQDVHHDEFLMNDADSTNNMFESFRAMEPSA